MSIHINILEAALEATRKEIAEQLFMVGESIQSIDPTLYEKERVLERVVTKRHHRPWELDTPMELKELEAALEAARRQELIDEAIKVTKDTITFCDDWTALDKLMAFVPTERLKEFLPVEEQDDE
jgi:hypothetical protein